MSLVVNNNLMAANVARNLNAHYGRLQTSTQRLSSGLRINSAADDAAGLAIRELQRADIAALHQGARNANDAISMIQVADGSLGIIDEKLIRMKELAEQAATGTYDSTQRLMIESEYQAMASEITRIANATDFNGTKLLDGTLDGEHDGSGLVSTGKMKIHFGTGNNSAEDYYYVTIGEVTSQALGLGNASTWQDVQNRGEKAFKDSLEQQIRNNKELSEEEKGKLLAAIGKMEDNGEYTAGSALEFINNAVSGAIDPAKAYELWSAADGGTKSEAEVLQGIKDAVTQAHTTLNLSYPWQGTTTTFKTTIQDPLVTAAVEAAKKAGYSDDAIASLQNVLNTLTPPSGTGTGTPTAPADTEWTQKDVTDWINDTFNAAITTDNLNNEVPKIPDDGFLADGKIWNSNSSLMADFLAAGSKAAQPVDAAKVTDAVTAIQDAFATGANPPPTATTPTQADFDAAWEKAMDAAKKAAIDSGLSSEQADELLAGITKPAVPTDNTTTWTAAFTITVDSADVEAALQNNADAAASQAELDKFWNGLRTTEKQKLQYAWGQAALYNLANAKQGTEPAGYGIGAEPADFLFSDISGVDAKDADGNLIADTIFQQALKDMQAKVGHMDFAGHTIETQEDAQQALDAINNAIVQKDKIRAHLGATQNRLENTVSNLNIQAENLQAAESRISDVDVATEMTQFVRNQILTQSAVAMLGQANSLPQMAMQLIGG